MKKFLTIIGLFFGVPLLLLLGLYLWTDPFRTLHAFDIHDVNTVNREYVSTELYLRNKDRYHYNAYVFGSSQASGLNTYTWKMYLPDSASTFLFQAWGENITGVKQKIEWLDANGAKIDHALIMIDMPGFFEKEQIHQDAISVKHYTLSGEPEWLYHAREYYNFLQRPSSWLSNVKLKLHGYKETITADSITNDWFADNAHNYEAIPKQDSLSQCTEQTRRNFFLRNANVLEDDVKMAHAVIDSSFIPTLQAIRAVFDKQQTEYYIIVTPIYRYTNPYMNPKDLKVLQDVFGEKRVYDFTTRKEYTNDYNDFFDPVHFGTRLGWFMLREIYTGEGKE